jgi:hypothetical protein
MSKDDLLQWTGTAGIVGGHSLNAVGGMDPYNIMVFGLGSLMYLIWAIRVANMPQIIVNAVSMFIGCAGLYRALG